MKVSELRSRNDILQVLLEQSMSAMLQHPGIVCADQICAVWASPLDLLGDDNAYDRFEDFSEPRLLLIQKMAFIRGMTLSERCHRVSGSSYL